MKFFFETSYPKFFVGKAQKISYTKKRGHIALLKNPKGD